MESNNVNAMAGTVEEEATAASARIDPAQLLRLAERMRRELDLKDRMIHLQTFRNTFTGPQAVAWLTSSVGGGAGSCEEAVDVANRMLRAGFIKNVVHKDTFTGREGDLLKFVTSALPPRDAPEPSSCGGQESSRSQLKKLGSGFSKEIVKLGKVAAMPLKKFEKAMDTFSDTITEYYYGGGNSGGGGGGGLGSGSGSVVGAHGPSGPAGSSDGGGAGGGGGSNSGGGAAAAAAAAAGPSEGGALRGAGPLGGQRMSMSSGGMGSRGARGVSGSGAVLPAARSSFKVLPEASLASPELKALESMKENLALIRLDLQQHTVLQEHMIGLFSNLQQHSRRQQLLLTFQSALAAALVSSVCGWPAWAVLLAGTVLALSWYLVSLPDPHVPLRKVSRAARRAAVRLLGRREEARRSFDGASSGGDEDEDEEGDRERPEAGGAAVQRQRSARATQEDGGEAGPFGSDAGPEERQPPRASAGGALDSWERGPGAGGAAAGRSGAGAFDEDDWAGPAPSDFDEWPDAPLMLTPTPAAPDQMFNGVVDPCQALRFNEARIPFETELFKGVVAVFVRHLPSTPVSMFKGRKRLTWVAIQGKFKQPVPVDSVVFGQEFSKPFKNLPAPWFIDNVLLPLARKISPAIRVGGLDAPHLSSPLITASQVINVSPEGKEPDLMEASEDMRPFMKQLSKGGVPFNVQARRKHFQVPKHRVGVHFSTQHVWTFHLWQEFVDYAAYVLSLSYSSYDLTHHLDGQPLQFMIKDMSSNRHIINLSAWHAKMARAVSRMPARAAPLSSSGGRGASDDGPRGREEGSQPSSPAPVRRRPAAAAGPTPPWSPSPSPLPGSPREAAAEGPAGRAAARCGGPGQQQQQHRGFFRRSSSDDGGSNGRVSEDLTPPALSLWTASSPPQHHHQQQQAAGGGGGGTTPARVSSPGPRPGGASPTLGERFSKFGSFGASAGTVQQRAAGAPATAVEREAGSSGDGGSGGGGGGAPERAAPAGGSGCGGAAVAPAAAVGPDRELQPPPSPVQQQQQHQQQEQDQSATPREHESSAAAAAPDQRASAAVVGQPEGSEAAGAPGGGEEGPLRPTLSM